MIVDIKLDFNPRQKYFSITYQEPGKQYPSKIAEGYFSEQILQKVVELLPEGIKTDVDLVVMGEIIADSLSEPK